MAEESRQPQRTNQALPNGAVPARARPTHPHCGAALGKPVTLPLLVRPVGGSQRSVRTLPASDPPAGR